MKGNEKENNLKSLNFFKRNFVSRIGKNKFSKKRFYTSFFLVRPADKYGFLIAQD